MSQYVLCVVFPEFTFVDIGGLTSCACAVEKLGSFVILISFCVSWDSWQDSVLSWLLLWI